MKNSIVTKATLVLILIAITSCGPSSSPGPKDIEACEPSQGAHTDSCWINDEERLTVRSMNDLERICESSCSKLSRLSVIDVDGIENLNFLAGLQEIGFLTVSGIESLRSLDGLDQVDSADTIRFARNPNLKDVSAIGALGELEYDLSIRDNDKLENLDGLQELKALGTSAGPNQPSLKIESNKNLKNLSGLSGIETIGGGNVYIRDNSNLRRVGGLQSVRSSPIGCVNSPSAGHK
jgi:hypothetical protein